MPCTFCSEEKVVAKGLCRNCYYRKRRTGTLEYKRKGKSPLACSFEGCDSPHVARGYCEAHYRTLRKHGDVISPFGYGEREKHELYPLWTRQTRTKDGRVKEWNDFWQFVADVPPRPSRNHKGMRHDVHKPCGPENFFWQEFGEKGAGAKLAARVLRKRHPLRYKSYSLKKQYGITVNKYLEMYERQGGLCAICGAHGESYASNTGRVTTLAVDHCHAGKQIRALLCPLCNKGLGCFKDSSKLLTKAVQYLASHELQP